MIPTRAFWFAAGAASGVAGALYAYGRVREVQGRFAADRLADTLSGAVVRTARSARLTVGEAMAEGRSAAREAEARIAVDLGRRPPLAGQASSAQ